MDQLVEGMTPLKREEQTGTTAVVLSSSIGTAPFLVYHYLVGEAGPGKEQFDADLMTLERAAELDAPGPRIVAHAVAGNEAYILTTTPAVKRALAGEDAGDAQERPSAEEAAKARRELPGQLVEALRPVNALAARWLSGVQADAERDGGGQLAFTDEEAELALFLLDDASSGDLLHMLNVVLTAARGQTGKQSE